MNSDILILFYFFCYNWQALIDSVIIVIMVLKKQKTTWLKHTALSEK